MGDFATVSHLLRSKMCGEEFDVKVLLPFSYTITEGAQLRYPTLYLLDPEPCLLPLLATSARAQHYYSIAEDGEKRAAFPEYIIVGIGYPRRPEEDSHTYWVGCNRRQRLYRYPWRGFEQFVCLLLSIVACEGASTARPDTDIRSQHHRRGWVWRVSFLCGVPGTNPVEPGELACRLRHQS
eukprot:scaffold518_cov388-Prasinococcus_capsulatus_cf.AAC.28